jgi:glycosidase
MLLFNSRDEKFKFPFGAVPSKCELRFTFPVSQSVNVENIFMIVRKEGEESFTIKLPYHGSDNGYNYFECQPIFDEFGIYWYRFEIRLFSRNTIYAGNDGYGKAITGEWLPEWQLTVYDKSYTTPDWLKGGLIYHIFPDRFARVEDGMKPKFGYLKSWSEEVGIRDADGMFDAKYFFGGNIKGIMSRLDYLQDLAVTAIYFSPIFESSSNHRYDTADYTKIDSLFGTEEEFKTLIEECNKREISIILDGVFNHTGADSIYFNRFEHYPSLGAYQSKESPYYEWFSFNKFPEHYTCWWGISDVPTVSRMAIDFQDLIAGDMGLIEKWTQLGVKGWRLDAVDEISPKFVKNIRKKLKSTEKSAVLIGEVWEDASTKESHGEKREYLFGFELDGVMNYPFRTAILEYIPSCNSNKFIHAVMSIAENYPYEALNISMTLIGSHDTIRVLNALSGVVAPKIEKDRLKYRLNYDEYALGKVLLKLAVVLQYFLPGVPTVYYGDECGIQGFEDPINHRPLPKEGDGEILRHYQKLGAIWKKYCMNFKGGFELFALDASIKIRRGNISTIVNPGNSPYYLPEMKHDLLSNQTVNAVYQRNVIIFEE